MNRVISYIVKIAGLVITAPVTFGVAASVFSDIQPPELRFLIQISALLVVEGVFITSWLSLDQDRNAPDQIRLRNAGTAWAMMIGLWILALQHGESLAGIVFRLALGMALLGSTIDSGVYTMIQENTRSDRNINLDRKVKKIARNLEREDRILELKRF